MSAIVNALNEAESFLRNENRAIIRDSQHNVRLALSQLGVTLSHDIFADRLLYAMGGGTGRLIDDAAIDRLWLTVDARFGFRPTKDFFITVLRDAARQNGFHPVRDYLDGLRWDGKSRLPNWLSTYGGAEENAYVKAVGPIVLIAAVRRARKPGVKFDEMLVLEGPQGKGQKSSALAALCPDAAWFSDDLPLDSDSKQVIERTSGRWLIEAAELSGMPRRDVEHLKAFLSRSTDIARLSYDGVPTERPRHFVVIGTTNSETYLRDTTGNRRFWPVRISAFDLATLKRDRDQIWAEAAAREAKGESIRLDTNLWDSAAEHQEGRRVVDPWEDVIAARIGDANGKLLCDEVWKIIGLFDAAHRTQEHNTRIGTVMKTLGFERQKARHEGQLRYHYLRGTKAEREVPIGVRDAAM